MCHPDGAQESELNKEVLASIEKLKRAAEKYRAPAAEAGAAKQIPSELKAPIKAFSLAVMRQNEKSKTALDSALDAIMPAMEHLASRRDFQVRSPAHSCLRLVFRLQQAHITTPRCDMSREPCC